MFLYPSLISNPTLGWEGNNYDNKRGGDQLSIYFEYLPI